MKKLIYLLAISLAATSCMKEEKHGDDTSAYNAKRMAEFYEKVMNAHDPSMIDSFCTDDFNDHQPPPGYPKGKEGLKASMKDFFSSFPDLKVNVNWVKAFGDTAIAHFTMKGTNSGSYMGGPPTNKSMDIEGMDVVIIKDGKATEHWGYVEEMKMMQQLGMMQQQSPMMDTATTPH